MLSRRKTHSLITEFCLPLIICMGHGNFQQWIYYHDTGWSKWTQIQNKRLHLLHMVVFIVLMLFPLVLQMPQSHSKD